MGDNAISQLLKALLYLIENPNSKSANNSFGYLENRDLLTKKTMRLLAGLPVNGQQFAPNQAWCEWAEANGCLPVSVNEHNNAADVVVSTTEVDDVDCLVGFRLNPNLELFACVYESTTTAEEEQIVQ
ncbi:unnamed protein product [Mesocestoides corti]|uniref:Restriction endonuclease subunit M n=1 Tax=Mesocestoides corti TaxID=53468 RepID=A0A0R3UPA5_MESCO|nr:unnamed protein product [Mesocestoides corti]